MSGPAPNPVPANERQFFHRAGKAKKKMNFPMAGRATKKERRIILQVSPGRLNKDKVFKPADKSLIMNLI